MARYGMGEGCRTVRLGETMNPKLEMDALVPYKPVIYAHDPVHEPSYKIKAIRGIVSNCRGEKAEHMGVYPGDAYQIFPGDQYAGICIELDEVVRTWDEEINDFKDEEGIFEELLLIQISDEADCCEVWGAMLSEDDLSRFIGSRLLEIYFTDTALNTQHLQTISKNKRLDDYHNVQFINIRTDKGTFQFAVYNCHNGYYGHDVSVRFGDGGILYSGVI